MWCPLPSPVGIRTDLSTRALPCRVPLCPTALPPLGIMFLHFSEPWASPGIVWRSDRSEGFVSTRPSAWLGTQGFARDVAPLMSLSVTQAETSPRDHTGSQSDTQKSEWEPSFLPRTPRSTDRPCRHHREHAVHQLGLWGEHSVVCPGVPGCLRPYVCLMLSSVERKQTQGKHSLHFDISQSCANQ